MISRLPSLPSLPSLTPSPSSALLSLYSLLLFPHIYASSPLCLYHLPLTSILYLNFVQNIVIKRKVGEKEMRQFGKKGETKTKVEELKDKVHDGRKVMTRILMT